MTEAHGIPALAEPCMGFDTRTRISTTVASRMVSAGYRWCARYLSRRAPHNRTHATLSSDEVAELLAAGLAIVPIQFGSSMLVPSASLGREVGEAAVAHADALSIPPTVTLWCDLEWDETVRADPGATAEYANAWHDAVVDAGYRAGLYVGEHVPLGGTDLGQLHFASYWKSAGAVPWVRWRGFQLVQAPALDLHGISCRPDLVAIDDARETFTWWAPLPCAGGRAA